MESHSKEEDVVEFNSTHIDIKRDGLYSANNLLSLWDRQIGLALPSG